MSTHTYRADEYVGIGTAGSILGVSASTLRRWEENGHLSSIRTLGGQRRYLVADLIAIRDRGVD